MHASAIRLAELKHIFNKYPMNKTLIVVAGGLGTRMGSRVPKQFLLLGGRPILMRTLELFHSYDKNMPIVVGLPDEYRTYWEDLCRQEDCRVPHQLTPAGETRFHTVQKALEAAAPGGLVAVHDAVRPLVSRDTIERCFAEAGKTGAAIPCVEVPESLRQVSHGRSLAVDRNTFRLVQTPQVFQYEILTKAYLQEYNESFTDDAGVVEQAGYTVSIVEGNRENIKITTPEDLAYAGSLPGT